MARVVAYRIRYGRFASYYKKFKIDTEIPVCECGAVLEPRYLTLCPRNWKVIREIKLRYQIATEEELYKFVMGKGYKGVGIREWLPRLVG